MKHHGRRRGAFFYGRSFEYVAESIRQFGWKQPIVVTDVPEEFTEQLKKEQEGAK